MSDQWELILHHTYAGTPGVIFDHSPGRGSHGVAVGLSDSNFHTDGAAAGSGAVSFGRGKRIRVTPTKGWTTLRGIRGEVICRPNRADSGGRLIHADSFKFHMVGGSVGLDIRTGTGFSRFFGEYPSGVLPVQWTKVGFVYDGIATCVITSDGVPLRTSTDVPLHQVSPAANVTIGSESEADNPFDGQIDDVKIWRLDPHFINNQFTGRPVPPDVPGCWVSWGRKFRDALDDLAKENSECPAHIVKLVNELVTVATAKALTHSESSRLRWLGAARQYQDYWQAGNLESISPILAGLESDSRADGLDLTALPEYQRLINDPCWKRLLETAPLMDCDVQFIDMLRGAVEA
ncbi:LamG-like jellyroll fold domain-containing protein [Mycolicibacterium hodleri]|nr:LamG-like jellyroll fold domain-containing protein [Mycolicibacterium hodleri]